MVVLNSVAVIPRNVDATGINKANELTSALKPAQYKKQSKTFKIRFLNQKKLNKMSYSYTLSHIILHWHIQSLYTEFCFKK